MNKQRQAEKGGGFFTGGPIPWSNVRIDLQGNRRAVVEGSVGILECGPEKITVKTCGSMNVCFTGKNLRVCCMDRDSLVVEGFFLSLSFVR